MQIDWTNVILSSIFQLIGRQFALKVGFAKWFDEPTTFCRKLEANKRWYNAEVLQQIQQRLEFTKFQCKPTGNDNDFWGESCTELAQFEGNYFQNRC